MKVSTQKSFLQFHRFLIFLALVQIANASLGDRSPEFEQCLTQCNAEQCNISKPISLPLPMQVTGWTCMDICKYDCMHAITDRNIERDTAILQYYGKWPFWRFGGIQEPASVAFSLFNLWSHLEGVRKIREHVAKTHPMRSYYLWGAYMSINAWIWSSVFHTRDLPATEKLDYFSAALAILYALYYTAIRLFHIYPQPERLRLTAAPDSTSRPRRSITHKVWSYLCSLIFLGHIIYLTLLPRFDYTYNMAFNLTLGLSHNALWLVYSLPAGFSLIQRFPSKPKNYHPPFVYKASIFVGLTTAATALELFDFPPWGRVIDAHALWHLSTVPLSLWWYDFLIEDASDSSWKGQRG
ncbi:Per1-like protein [Infundibulicybe gibba]|nr:Per1-like protein [Infundibulicybe gibba]